MQYYTLLHYQVTKFVIIGFFIIHLLIIIVQRVIFYLVKAYLNYKQHFK